jgi:O-acetyl-ADP-ribose deacetylase (regulator of RNase III)
MLENGTGSLLEAEAEALVNTVNCVGYMGKGIALQFRQAYPPNYVAYHHACTRNEIVPGRMFVFPTGNLTYPRYIINFPTKRHWRAKSRIEDIESGLIDLVKEVTRLGIKSIAVPPLGCGNGGLNWRVVRPLIVEAFEQIPDVRVLLFAPAGAPDAKAMPVRTKDPSMTRARAILVQLLGRYLEPAYRLTLLEVHKLAYFAQEAGEPLKLNYQAGYYGPYAPNLDKVLQRIEGHFTRGFGDSPKPDNDVELLPGALEKADAILEDAPEAKQHARRVAELIEGFETPYGMELLATVHWVGRHGQPPAKDIASAVNAIHSWSDRKRKMFQPAHIKVAWDRLCEAGWFGQVAAP